MKENKIFAIGSTEIYVFDDFDLGKFLSTVVSWKKRLVHISRKNDVYTAVVIISQ